MEVIFLYFNITGRGRALFLDYSCKILKKTRKCWAYSNLITIKWIPTIILTTIINAKIKQYILEKNSLITIIE